MGELALLCNYLMLGGILFVTGLVGFLVRRNMIVIFLCAEMMLQGVSVSLVGWGRYHSDWGGQVMALFIVAIAACEAGIALALILMLVQRSGSLDIAVWQSLREPGRRGFVDREIPEDRTERPEWPKLTPAGPAPPPNDKDELYRSRV